jgi:hypothetical protein
MKIPTKKLAANAANAIIPMIPDSSMVSILMNYKVVVCLVDLWLPV